MANPHPLRDDQMEGRQFSSIFTDQMSWRNQKTEWVKMVFVETRVREDKLQSFLRYQGEIKTASKY